ncbi:hypothetical protein [Streptomyces sp. NPDC001652]|uniref:hypothetical protein n=1 Tax=Streptomyces sp. NPDC001652 TaxID=3154393 RepID=UPI003317DDEF
MYEVPLLGVQNRPEARVTAWFLGLRAPVPLTLRPLCAVPAVSAVGAGWPWGCPGVRWDEHP